MEIFCTSRTTLAKNIQVFNKKIAPSIIGRKNYPPGNLGYFNIFFNIITNYSKVFINLKRSVFSQHTSYLN